MTDDASATDTAASDTSTATSQAADGQSTDQGAATGADQSTDTTDWKAEAQKWESRAKANGTRAKELEKQQRSTMTEAERALSEAESKGRTAATQQFGSRLARTEFDAAAARRNPDFDTASVLEYVNLARFVGEDGEPDTKAIKAAAERLVPLAGGATPSYDGGSRGGSTKVDFNQELRRAAGRA